ncbi:MAG: UDP-N-acetylmuramyl-tripeptide synthetase, partial [Planctomycetes bacterium]|nr:UDP-N-acetylmuramyl-tripeptide synthetase [Planctomycetota bacterium]
MLHTLRRQRLPVHLRSLFPRASFVGCADISVTDATDDSRECRPNLLFAAVPGCCVNGTRFAAEAVRFGATSLLVQRPLAEISVPQCVVPDVRRSFGQLCSALADRPSRKLSVVGITGTNGKTTTTWLVRSILQTAGRSCGLLGTVEYDDGLQTESARLTTPGSRELVTWLARMVDRGTTHAAIELSSHALHQSRVAGTELDVAVVTNVTQDHFDYHHNFSEYLESKSRIFQQLKPDGIAVLNLDDPGAASLLDRTAKTTTFAVDQSADVTAEVVHESLAGSRFVLRGFDEPVLVQTSLPGRHNISNCLAATAAVRHLGVSADAVAAGIESLPGVPGRLQCVNAGQPFQV